MSSTLTRESGKPGAPPAPGRGSWLIRDEDRHVAPARIAGTELAVAVVAPAVGFATGRDSARVTEARRQQLELQTSGNRERQRSVGHRSVAELARAVVAPAIRRAIDRQGARVSRAGGDREKAQPAADRARGPGTRLRATRGRTGLDGSAAQFTVAAPPPAVRA